MTTTTNSPAPATPGTPMKNALASGRLHTRTPWVILAGSLAVSLILFFLVAAASGQSTNWTGAIVVGGLLNLIATWVVSRAVEGGRQAANRFVTALVSTAFVLALIPLLSLLWTLISKGIARFDGTFFSSSMVGVVFEGGGGIHAIIGTLLITLTATIISVPIGLFTAIYLVEYGKGWLARAINFFVDVMTGVPSIVAGLFAYTLFMLILNTLGLPLTNVRNGFAGALSLTVLMIPTVVRSSEEMIRLVPNELREASYALGVPKWLTISKVVLPTAIAGITTGVMLAISRVIGESAPLLIAAGFNTFMNYNLFQGPMMSLPVFVYRSYTQQVGAGAENMLNLAWTGALVLLLIVMVLNLVARLIAHFFAPKGR
ncbi:phosphate ABC transporter permease PstA [Pseudoclavibacter chungangensis]|uniref:Phosphate transport system permease protein PstA n=1 Tax=Pseudoclavibacter chungangensis TaxID=587635 RepID=A0A7J5C0B3_9MICO|nr:phosphate ABC transporter permease PstA [Pseudoclavibacter chungangensis]KAB1660327.1 phosphate ABC transporter permease PstA [Pseudoclavibacter chungangensis]NYJ65683.1 phosphate transport system permease protein [Pseudoclavibacter chungangensis]